MCLEVGKQGRTGTDTEKSPLYLKMGRHKHLRHSQAEFSSLVGKVSWRERQSRKWPKATHEQLQELWKAKGSKSRYEGSMGDLESGGPSPMQIL